ncbi:hypothetical protein BDF20DRAFT_850917 [Mycotypha africana]|uniref:uncharacterized protein n=1 Tax=Mycotypha africana TaxID=64632 RepID=UPI002300C7CE|nr:uncharacterized protein BDF20DRAFT_850917 [Mycotypha africana]KAI8987563.1 hypothetical protein BDF20DRAFT_850917 [Mycotypha africana]
MAKTKQYVDDDSDVDKEYKPQVSNEEDEEEFEEESSPAQGASSSKKRQREDEPDVQRDKDGNAFFPLSAKRRLTIRPFKTGEPSIDIREFYSDKATQEMRPGKAGICLPINQWNQIVELLPVIQQIVDSMGGTKSKKQK